MYFRGSGEKWGISLLRGRGAGRARSLELKAPGFASLLKMGNTKVISILFLFRILLLGKNSRFLSLLNGNTPGDSTKMGILVCA